MVLWKIERKNISEREMTRRLKMSQVNFTKRKKHSRSKKRLTGGQVNEKKGKKNTLACAARGKVNGENKLSYLL